MYPQCIQFDYYELDSLNIPRVICTDTVKLYCPVKKYYCDSFITVDTKSNNVKCFDPSIITGLPCSQLYNPVCGCNGVTYSNACLANEAGIASFTVGKCDTTVFPSISDCCYTLDLNENVFAISGEILTPGVIFF
ncbi:MAG: hypothetical protein IPG55_00165 [Saprospiraceae bacterium]|nr:hypothetical protein [Candidatus Defluviibacterium haderslevense]